MSDDRAVLLARISRLEAEVQQWRERTRRADATVVELWDMIEADQWRERAEKAEALADKLAVGLRMISRAFPETTGTMLRNDSLREALAEYDKQRGAS